MPARRIAAAVKTCDDGQHFVGFNDKHERVRKATKQSAADAFVDDRELSGIGAHALDYVVDRRAEMSAQARSLVLVPVLRVNQLGAGGQGENNRIFYGQRCSSSAFKAVQLMPSGRSWSSVARRRSSSARCGAVKGSWPSSKLSQSCEISARRSGGVRRTSSSWVSKSICRAYEKARAKATGEARPERNQHLTRVLPQRPSMAFAGYRPRHDTSACPATYLTPRPGPRPA